MKRLTTIAAMSVLALTIAACGSSGGDGTGSNGSSSAGSAPGSSGSSAASSAGSGSSAGAGAGSGSSASGGSSGSSSASAPGDQNYAEGKTFTMIISADPGNLDPQMTSLSAAYQADLFLYDSLTSLDKDGKMIPNLAEKWDGSTTEASYTLRQGITCSDGSPLTASVVADNINFVGDPKNKSTRIGIFVPPGATAKGDDKTGTVTVTSPTPAAFLARGVGMLPIVCAKGMADRSILKQGSDGTGMFTLTEAVPSDHYTLTRRTDYAWGPGDFDPKQAGLPAKVVLKVVQNESTAANLLLAGQANFAQIVGPDKDRVAATKAYQQFIQAAFGELWYNHKSGTPGSDEAVRRALTQALDLDQLGKVITSGTGKPTTGLLVSDLTPCPGNTVQGNLPAHDVDAAKAALDAAGWKVGDGGTRSKDGKPLAITLYYPTTLGAAMQSGAELMQKAWTAVGAKVTIKPMTDTEAATILLAGQGAWDAALLPLNVTQPNQLVPFLSGPSAPDGQNFSHIDNAGYTDAVAKAQSKAGEAGCGDWNSAEVALFQHVDMVPFVNSAVPGFAVGATFQFIQGTLAPWTIRMLG